MSRLAQRYHMPIDLGTTSDRSGGHTFRYCCMGLLPHSGTMYVVSSTSQRLPRVQRTISRSTGILNNFATVAVITERQQCLPQRYQCHRSRCLDRQRHTFRYCCQGLLLESGNVVVNVHQYRMPSDGGTGNIAATMLSNSFTSTVALITNSGNGVRLAHRQHMPIDIATTSVGSGGLTLRYCCMVPSRESGTMYFVSSTSQRSPREPPTISRSTIGGNNFGTVAIVSERQ